MNGKRNIFGHPALLLPLLICLIGASTAGVSIIVLFGAAIEEDKNRLSHILNSQANLMEAVATFDAANSANDYPNGAFGATMEQIMAAHKSMDGFGETGEFVIGRLIDGKVAILSKPRHNGDINFEIPEFIPIPMKRALAGESGTTIATDYKGHQVLASYRPVDVLNIGLVAKVDTNEVYRPFVLSSLIAAALTLLMLILGVYASRKFSTPFIQLEQEKKRAEKYLNIADMIIVALDQNGDIKLINEKGCRVLGCDRKELIGRNWFDKVIPEGQRDQIRQVFLHLMEGNDTSVEHYENEIIDRNGQSHMIAWHNSYIRDANGNISSCISAGEDVTKYKAVESALRVSQTRFNKSQGFANIGTWDWNIQTGDLYWSDRIARLFGYAEGELETTYENFLGAIHPDDRQAVMDAVNACVENGAEYNIEHRAVWPDGTVHWLHERGDVVRDDDGKPLNMLGVVQDITKRKWTEDEILRLSRHNELILNAAGDGIYGVDMEGVCTFVNPAAAAMLGYETEELINKKYDFLRHIKADESSCPEFKSPIHMALQDGQAHAASDEVFWRKDGSHFFVEYTSTPIYEDGVVKGAVVVFRNINDRKEMQAQLIQSSKMATLGEMATGVAHELNQPLNIIRMAVANLVRKAKKDEIDLDYMFDKLGRVEVQVDRAAAIINHMRIFGRKSDKEMRLLDPAGIVKSSADMLGEQMRLSSIRFELDAPEGLPKIKGHQVQMEQVFLNLLGNARDSVLGKADGEKRIKVTIDEMDDSVRFRVEDTGGGMDPDILSRVFEPFYTSKEVGKGTGLGLSITYGIINDAGGSITVENVEGGACFTITLPACREDRQTA